MSATIFLSIPINYPKYYWTFAIVFSSYFGFMAYRIQRRLNPDWALFDRVVVHYIRDIIFNFTCSLAGWIAFDVLCQTFQRINPITSLSPGGSAATVFLTLIAIFGISGMLPHMFVIKNWWGK